MQTVAIELAWVALLPVVVAATTMWLARWLSAPSRAVWAASVGLGYIAGQVVLTGRTAFAPALGAAISPREAHDWLSLIVLSAVAVSILADCAPAAWHRAILGLAALLVIGTLIRLLAGNIAQHWSLGEKFAHLALLAAALALIWLSLASADDGRHPRTRMLLTILVAAASAAILVKSGTMLYGQLAGVIAAAIAGTALAQNCWGLSQFFRVHEEKWNCPPLPDSSGKVPLPSDGLSGAAGVITLALGSLLILGHFYSELPALTAALLAFSLVAAGGHLPVFATRSPAWQQTVIRAIFCLIPLTVAAISV